MSLLFIVSKEEESGPLTIDRMLRSKATKNKPTKKSPKNEGRNMSGMRRTSKI